MDPKLKLKPIELIDIGIDKHTKIPVPILTTNIVATYDDTEPLNDSFNIKIININENIDNIILTDGLTIELVKLRYNWFLNANVKNCIIGEDSYGLVWYSGEWLCGEWIKGTWYSGIWHDGVWRDGKFYSYLIDEAMIISNRFVILDKSNFYSEFRSGTWLSGNFYSGTFGYDPNLNQEATYSDLINRTFISAYWENGWFHDGIFKKSVWLDGIFYKGEMESSYWLNGRFYSGTFYFHNPQGTANWYNGYWYGGDFVEGSWLNGTFDQIDTNIKSRFGTSSSNNAYTVWWNGKFLNGEFHSGLNVDSVGNTLPSITDGLTHWVSGDFYNGKWYGGYFLSGIFHNGEWFSGIFNTTIGESARNNCIWEFGNWYSGLWVNGIFKRGHFYSGMWLDGLFLNGYLSTNNVESIIEPQKLFNDVFLPKVLATGIDQIKSNSAIFKGVVTDNGGAYILDRGVCWTTSNTILPIKENVGVNHFISDQGTMGDISILIEDLSYSTEYYLRAYAINVTGISYSNLTGFTTIESIDGAPSVITLAPFNITNEGVSLWGRVNASSTGSVSQSGFYYSSVHTIPDASDDSIINLNPTIIGEDYNCEILNGLTGNTTYYIRAFAENIYGPGFGQVQTFKTLTGTTITEPIVIFAPTNPDNVFESISSNGATARGFIVYNGNSFVDYVGACFIKESVAGLPTILDNIIEIDDSSSPYFYIDITGLNSGESYKVRLYAINRDHLVGYSDMQILTTSLVTTTPTVIMLDVSDITP